MVGIVNDILKGFDENKCTVMLFLDLSAAFDTIDIDKLIKFLSEEIGLRGTALKWCKSFLSHRTQRVKRSILRKTTGQVWGTTRVCVRT